MTWQVRVDQNILTGIIEVRMRNRFPDGTVEFPVTIDSIGVHTYRIDGSAPDHVPTSEPLAIPLEEEAARALMEELQRHFGAYAGVDYQRLRKDYDRVVEEASEANGFIRETLKTIITNRKPPPSR